MPQLDSLTYLTQFTWFFTIFILLYLNNLEFLPDIALILKTRNSLKLRKNKLDNNAPGVGVIETLSLSNLNSIDNLILNINSNGKTWYQNKIEGIKSQQLSVLNQIYVDYTGLIMLQSTKKLNKNSK